jgi:hypothetical protein
MSRPNTPVALPSITASAPGFPHNADGFSRADADAQTALVLSDYQAAYDALEQGKLAPFSGLYVAYYNGQMVGSGNDDESLRRQLSADRQIHPERLAVIHVKSEIVL